jgi:hypothetical protein
MAIQLRQRLLCAPLCSFALVVVAPAIPATAAEPGPGWVTPHNGDQLPYLNDLTFTVTSIPGANEYLYGFFENGRMVWENYANEGRLDGTTYFLPKGSEGHRALGSGAQGQVSWSLQLWARGYIDDGLGNYHWSEASIIDVTLVGFGCIIGPGGRCDY